MEGLLVEKYALSNGLDLNWLSPDCGKKVRKDSNPGPQPTWLLVRCDGLDFWIIELRHFKSQFKTLNDLLATTCWLTLAWFKLIFLFSEPRANPSITFWLMIAPSSKEKVPKMLWRQVTWRKSCLASIVNKKLPDETSLVSCKPSLSSNVSCLYKLPPQPKSEITFFLKLCVH